MTINPVLVFFLLYLRMYPLYLLFLVSIVSQFPLKQGSFFLFLKQVQTLTSPCRWSLDTIHSRNHLGLDMWSLENFLNFFQKKSVHLVYLALLQLILVICIFTKIYFFQVSKFISKLFLHDFLNFLCFSDSFKSSIEDVIFFYY